eukprot:877185-Amphidinium_carterae.1
MAFGTLFHKKGFWMLTRSDLWHRRSDIPWRVMWCNSPCHKLRVWYNGWMIVLENSQYQHAEQTRNWLQNLSSLLCRHP